MQNDDEDEVGDVIKDENDGYDVNVPYITVRRIVSLVSIMFSTSNPQHPLS